MKSKLLAYHCPCCQSWLDAFEPFGSPPRPDARCPTCGALERDRLVWLFFNRRTRLFDRGHKRMLHVAPERSLENRFRQVPGLDYLTADLENERAMVRMDITDIQYPDDSFDLIYCSHVLEHVLDDRRAMRQMYRVLRPAGCAVIMVPIRSGPTLEDPLVTDPDERTRLYGQHDHVRAYGDDIVDRLAEAGFTVERFGPTDFLDSESIARFVPKGVIFACHKPQP